MDELPFNRLPAELRNYIYELALSASGPISGRYSYKDSAWTFDLRFRYDISLGITRTCRQIYEESKDLVFVLNTFEIKTTPDSIVPSWLRIRDYFTMSQLSDMQRLVFDVGDEFCVTEPWRKQMRFLPVLHGIRLVLQVHEFDEGSVAHQKVVVRLLKGWRSDAL